MLHGLVPGSGRAGAPGVTEPIRGSGVGKGMNPLAERQTARALLRAGKRFKLQAEVDVTPVGLLSITALVCGILLSTTVLVAKTIRESR